MATMKFKIGDKVIGNHPTRYAYTKLGWKGVVTRVLANGEFDARGDGNPDHNGTFYGLEPQYFDLIPTNNEKIVITHDGKVTTATLYGVMGTRTTATARCAPEDKFDFRVGAEIAMGRLVDKLAYANHNVIRVVFREGERPYSYITRMQTAKVGMKIIVPVGAHRIESKATVVEIIPGAEYNGEYAMSAMKEIDIVEAPEYYNGKVVCINAPNRWWTKGKIYSVVNGIIIDDDGDKRYEDDPITPKFEGCYGKMFLPIVEDENKPLTIDEIEKMDGQKVYVINLDIDGKEEPQHKFCGWHTVDVEKGQLIDVEGLHYNFEYINTGFGYHAYRQAPRK